MPPPGDQPSVDRLDWRLTELEKKFDANFAHIEQRFDRLGSSIAGLTYVDARLYNSEQATQDRSIASLAALIEQTEERLSKRIDGAESGNRATLVLLLGVVLTALAGGLVRLALG